MNETIINEVCFYPLRPNEKGLIGFASCLFDKKLSLNSIAVYTKPDGDIRLLFPNKYLPNSKEITLYYPIDTQTYEEIRQAIIKKIEELAEKAKGEISYERHKRIS